jgi:hypothetical protein
MTEARSVVRRSGLARWGGVAAIAYVVLFIVGAILEFGGQPDLDAPPREVIDYFSDGGNRDKIALGWIIIVIAVFFFLWFVAALRQTLLRLDDEGILTTVATVGGTVYAAVTLAGASLSAGIKTMSDDTFQHRVYPELIHASDDAGYVMHSAGGAGMGALMIAASLVAARAGLVPRWASWVGIVAGILAVFSIFFLPQILIGLWLIAAGLVLLRAAARPAAPVPAA